MAAMPPDTGAGPTPHADER